MSALLNSDLFCKPKLLKDIGEYNVIICKAYIFDYKEEKKELKWEIR